MKTSLLKIFIAISLLAFHSPIGSQQRGEKSHIPEVKKSEKEKIDLIEPTPEKREKLLAEKDSVQTITEMIELNKEIQLEFKKEAVKVLKEKQSAKEKSLALEKEVKTKEKKIANLEKEIAKKDSLIVSLAQDETETPLVSDSTCVRWKFLSKRIDENCIRWEYNQDNIIENDRVD